MKTETSDKLADTIRSAGFRATMPRLLVLSCLKKTQYPLSIKDIAEAGKENVDHVTVYRILDAFKKAGIVSQVDFQHGRAYYELKDERRDHHHIVCTSCRRVEDFTDDAHTRLATRAMSRSHSFSRLTGHSFELYGLCNTCAARA